MKIKIIIICLLLICSIINIKTYAIEDVDFCPSSPIKIGNKYTWGISKYSGTNFLITQVASAQLGYSLEKYANDKFDVDFIPYGAKSFSDGKFKSLTLYSKNPNFEGFYITDFKAKSACSYNHVKLNPYNTVFYENFVLDFEGTITQEDLNKSILRPKYKESIKEFNNHISKLIAVKVYEPKIEILNDKIGMNFKVLLPLVGTKNINTKFNLEAKNGDLLLCDLSIDDKTNLSSGAILTILNIFNPLSFDFKINKNIETTIKANNIEIKDSKIFIEGSLFVPKNHIPKKEDKKVS